MKAASLMDTLSRFPWRNTAWAMRQRFREDRLGLTASSLTFTTTLALVPLFTVALALFTAFPMFSKLQGVLQRWLVESLIPDNIAKQVLGYLTLFATQASKLGTVGLVAVLVTALLLILTIDRTLNAIWRVRQPRPLAQRVLIYWAALTLGPLLLGASLTATSYLVSASRGLVSDVPGGLRFMLDLVEFAGLSGAVAALYHFVPNAPVKWAHAWAGGVFVATGIELAKRLLAVYLGLVPTYSAMYGAFATLPILLLWIYVVWVIVLLGAVLAAYLPSLLNGVARRADTPGWQFQLALEVLQCVHRDGTVPRADLAVRLRVDAIQVGPVLEHLLALDWVGVVEASEGVSAERLVLLVEPAGTRLAALVQRLLLPDEQSLKKLWENSHLGTMHLSEVL
ncbi:MAG: hypothetical protein RLZZ401_2283 [Pseudomonadota bacterium]